MNYFSININGVSDSCKGNWIRSLKQNLKVDFLGIQETHVEFLSDVVLRRFWGNSKLGVEYVHSDGRSGGLASLWDPDVFTVQQVTKNHRFLVLSGQISGIDEKVNIINVHAPNDPSHRRLLWRELADLIADDEFWILLGDFNDVRSPDERVNSRFDNTATDVFNSFLSSVGLLEYPMAGGRFTYFSGHEEVKMSKLDRFLVNDRFMSRWPNASLMVHRRSLSDHCPLSLSCSSTDFGPVPFKFFNSWFGDQGLTDIVEKVLVPVHNGAVTIAD